MPRIWPETLTQMSSFLSSFLSCLTTSSDVYPFVPDEEAAGASMGAGAGALEVGAGAEADVQGRDMRRDVRQPPPGLAYRLGRRLQQTRRCKVPANSPKHHAPQQTAPAHPIRAVHPARDKQPGSAVGRWRAYATRR